MGSPVIRRYPMPVPESARTIWVSQTARDLWAPRLSSIGVAWSAIERASVGPVRMAARQQIQADQFAEFSRKATMQGLTAVALRHEGIGGAYQARPADYIPGQPLGFQVALCASSAVAKTFLAAWDASDDASIGELLGFPPCCVAFFRRVWVEEGWIDTTWPTALNTALAPGDLVEGSLPDATHERRTFTKTPVEANILLRWLGVRWVPHLPCSFGCEGTAALGRQFRALMRDGFPKEAAWIDELLDAPIEWSGWKGYAEIKTPILKIVAKTDATVERLVVRRTGSRQLEAAATGNAFPYLPVATVAPLKFYGVGGIVSKPTMVLVGEPGPEHSAPNPTEWTDNGFSSFDAMETAHGVIRRFFVEWGGAPTARVLDFGCGNGRLVASLTTNAVGVDVDVERCERAESRGVLAYAMSITDFAQASVPEQPFDVVLLMPGRLTEMKPHEQLDVKLWLSAHAKHVIVYAYGDWLTRYPNYLAGLCEAAGLPTQFAGERFDHVAVGLVDMEALKASVARVR